LLFEVDSESVTPLVAVIAPVVVTADPVVLPAPVVPVVYSGSPVVGLAVVEPVDVGAKPHPTKSDTVIAPIARGLVL
jgi:hypothetical protein